MTTILDIDQLIDETNKDKKELLKKYRKYLLQSIFMKGNNKNYQDALKEYKQLYLSENSKYLEYLEFLRKNFYSINREELAKVLTKLEFDCKDAYTYYLLLGELESFLYPDRIVETYTDISKNQQLADEIKGLAVCQGDIDKFFGYSEALFFAKEKTRVLNAGDDLSYYGVYPRVDDNILRTLFIKVPSITNLQSALINVHELQHAIELYDMIGHEYNDTPEFCEEREKNAKAAEKRFLNQCIRNK